MNMEQDGPDRGGFFLRLVQRSKRLLQQRPDAASEQLAEIPTLIESEIIPRLQMSFQSTQIATDHDAATPVADEFDVTGFVKMLLSPKPDDARETIDYLRKRGYTLVQIYGSLLTPAARHLGVLWEEDECSFAEVTIAMMKIRHIFATTAPLFPVTGPKKADNAPAIILTTVPGEQHTFGMYLTVEHFRAAGWHVWSGASRNTRELVELVGSEHCDVIGISIGAATNLPTVQAAVKEARAHSVNPDVKIIAGGQLFSTQPELFDDSVFDLTSDDIDTIVEQTESLLGIKRESGP